MLSWTYFPIELKVLEHLSLVEVLREHRNVAENNIIICYSFTFLPFLLFMSLYDTLHRVVLIAKRNVS